MRPPPPRRWVQGALLLGFLFLFAHTVYRGQDLLDWPVHLVLRLDPLALAAEVLAVGLGALTWAWLGAVLLLVASALLGRFFCGWACPLGTILDLARGGLRRLLGHRGSRRRIPPRAAPLLLVGLVTAGSLGLPLLGVFDPLSLLLRSLTLAVHPLADAATKGVLGSLTRASFPLVSWAGEALHTLLEPALAFGRPAFLLAGLTGLVFAAVLALELWAPRHWCSSLCPLGALLGLAGRFSPLRRRASGDCGACSACASWCPSGAAAFDPADPATCLQCGECVRSCSLGARQPALASTTAASPTAPSRRALFAALGGGALLALAPRVRAEEREVGLTYLRPPGARPGDEFTRRCIRCGACMRVCPRGALHPALLEAGLGGVWTPRLLPRIGYCEYHCRLCGQVCPTGALGYLEEGEKERTVIGLAVFDTGRCLPYRKARNCMVCEEHCPTAPKAIVFREEAAKDPLGSERFVKLPSVVEERCVGCGICENKCPLPGRGAIQITREIPGDLSSFY